MSLQSGERSALIFGVSGQDGGYLARLLLDKGYRVIGASRSARAKNLHWHGASGQVGLLAVDPGDPGSVDAALRHSLPDEVYNLSGQSSVGLSFEHPQETLRSTLGATINLLEGLRKLERPVRLFNAGSAECFGDTRGERANESTPMRPWSPYAVGKAGAFWQVATHRSAYGLHASTGILFNHESPLRSERFVTQKIVRAACRIASGDRTPLELGNIDIERDWGWAPEYVQAMWTMLQQDQPSDFVLATGETRPLADFIHEAFACVGLDWHEHVKCQPQLLRPTDVRSSLADPSRARSELGWEAATKMAGVVRLMVEAEQKRLAEAPESTNQEQE
jgi:GDPmannose 4,6-dehydratase